MDRRATTGSVGLAHGLLLAHYHPEYARALAIMFQQKLIDETPESFDPIGMLVRVLEEEIASLPIEIVHEAQG
ncbi:hypothetical protein LCGC14_1284200 [marine sediment metagenome]|uniref:Uncharacterized protein n=1 Tax=marine sediment metagenome TaxID=412755 RepID=A0A0F9LFC3_9ZZZZ